jgi:hypothetical protein
LSKKVIQHQSGFAVLISTNLEHVTALERLLAARGLLEVRLPASYKRTQEETLK